MIALCFLKLLPLCGWLALLVSTGSPARGEPPREQGRPFLQNFALRDYHAHNQNWAAVQDAQGILYFGNKNVVLEYDGVSWRKLVIDRTTYVRGLAIEPGTETIFIGAVDELGYFAAGAEGAKQFVSLRAQLPEDARDFRDIRRVFATNTGVWFIADQQAMRWRDGAFRVWKFPNSSRLQSHWVADRLYLQHADIGLLRLEDEEFVAASADPLFQRTQITLLTPSANGSLLLGTMDDGLFVLRDGAVAPFPTEVDSFLKAQKLRRGLRLRDGSLALATASSGLVVLGPDGQLHCRVDESVDLQNDTILDLFEDREGGLWLSLNSGITRVEVASPLSTFDAANGLKRSTVRDVLRFRDTIYFAAADGIYRLLPADPATARTARGERIAGPASEWWSLCAHDAGLLAAGSEGVTQLSADGITRKLASGVPALVLRRSQVDPDRVFLGTRDGLRSIRREPIGEWRDEGVVAGTNAEIRTIVETPRGEVWLGTPISGVLRVTFAGGTASERGVATVATFRETHGLPKGQHWTRVIASNTGGAFFATQAGLYRFDDAAQLFRAVPDFGTRFADGSFMLGAVVQDSAGDLWLAGRRHHGVWLDQELGRALAARDGKAAAFEVLPYKIADKVGEIEKFYGDGSAVWIAGTEGVVRVDVERLRELSEAPPIATVIRRAITTAKDGTTAEPQRITTKPLPHSRNSVRFEFAANTYALGAGLRYRTRLGGFEQGSWSDFTDRTSVEYTNLPENSYIFEVQARDVNGRVASIAALPFQIAPPWHRTYAAYTAYTLLLAGFLFALARWQVHRFQRKQTKLESLIAARTGELRAREAELLSAKEAADTANRAKSAFLANMSHELRTPLNAILGYTQILLKDDAQSPKNRERLGVVDQSGNHLLAMINEVLDLSKIEAGKMALNPSDFGLQELIDDIGAAFRQRVAEKGVDFQCGCAPEMKRVVHADAGKLRQVLFNLLGNAVKFTERGGVRLEVVPLGERVRFEVKDTGIGIAPDELRDIFLTFHQAKTNTAGQGSGLGLAISERLVDLLGGRLQVESEPGQGSRFWFELELPTVALAGVAEPLPPMNGNGRHLPVTGFHGTARRLLIADDEPTNRDVLRELLEPLGFEIEEAADGATCLAQCAQHLPDALLLDLQMPELDGFEVARRLRGQSESSALKIVAVSASVFEYDQQLAINAGCDDFLPKPFKEEQLLAVLGKVLALEWTYAATNESHELEAAENGATPPVAEIDAILELSRRGDILGVKKRLATLATLDGGAYSGFVQSLEPFVASYQMNRIRDVLLKLKEEQP